MVKILVFLGNGGGSLVTNESTAGTKGSGDSLP